jgi:hypothetical protein
LTIGGWDASRVVARIAASESSKERSVGNILDRFFWTRSARWIPALEDPIWSFAEAKDGFHDVSELRPGAKVKVAGVDVGTV